MYRTIRPIRVRLATYLWLAVVLSMGCQSIQVSRLYEKGALATAAPAATAVGIEIFEAGGNAFDVAVAVGFALAVVYPEAGNIGGGGFAVIRDGETKKMQALDFREKAPAAASEKMYLDDADEVVPALSTTGGMAVGVPGTVAGLHELWKRHGSLPWAQLIRPAIGLADTGFTVDSYLAESLGRSETKLHLFPQTKRIFLPGGQAPLEGDRFIQKELAATLKRIAVDELGGFYTGTTAEKITACMNEHGGLISSEDLLSYRPVWREPIRFDFDDYAIYSMPPPSSGGICAGQILGLLEPFELTRFSSTSPEYIHLFSEASRLAFADRSEHLGDPDFFEIPAGLLDSAYLAKRRGRIKPGVASSSQETQAGSPAGRESDQTTHYSVADSQGNVVAVTYTLNSAYGSLLVVDGAGFLLNNEMDDFSIKPGVPNLYGLVGGEANKIEPGKRMLSSMSPTIVLKEDRPVLVLGSPGGSKIITVVAQAILSHLRFDMGAEELVKQPRFHHQWLPDMIYLETGAYGINTKQELIRYGHNIIEREPYSDLQLVVFDSNGFMIPASDPRGGGAPGGL